MAEGFTPIDIRPFERRLIQGSRSFASGQPELDDWLYVYAGQRERSNNTRTFLALADSSTVVGYYATTAFRIERDDVALRLEVGNRRYPIPAVLLAWLAVDRHWQRLGIGRQLLVDALRRCFGISTSLGFELVLVEAIDDAAVTFYLRYGFARFDGAPRMLCLTIRQLQATFACSTT